jgi:hypothetical protein
MFRQSQLITAQNDMHAYHTDGLFCTTIVRPLEDMSFMLGLDAFCFISQENKCRVAVSLKTASK